MPRLLSTNALRSALAQYTTEVWLQLLTITRSEYPPNFASGGVSIDDLTEEQWYRIEPSTAAAPTPVLTRLVHNPVDVESTRNFGTIQQPRNVTQTFKAAHWDLILPPSDKGRLPIAQFRFHASTRELIEEVRSLTTTVNITHEIVLDSNRGKVEVGPIRYQLRNVEYNANSIEGTLGFEQVLHELYPKDTFVPSRFPGLFQ